MPALRILPIIALAFAGETFVAGHANAQETAAPAASVPEPIPVLHYSNKWRLEVSEGANNAGVMHFRLTPQDGTPTDIRVPLKDGRGEDGCARDIRDAFKSTLDKTIFKIELDDGEDVLVKNRKGPDFAIELVESTVEGTRVNIDRE